MIITKSYCHNVLVSVSTFLDFEKLVSFFCFFFLSFSWYCCTKSGGEKERKNILLGPSILKKNCTEMVVNEGGNRTSNEEIKDF